MHGYELKSDRDNLQRLPEQVSSYAAVFDLVTLVVSERHLRNAIDVIPDWWGIKVARVDSTRPFLWDLKLPILNPSLDPMSLLSLLWRNEALALAQELCNNATRSGNSRESICAELLRHSSLDYLSARVRHCLRTRPNWRAGGTRESCDG
jgi:hypothetical protein